MKRKIMTAMAFFMVMAFSATAWAGYGMEHHGGKRDGFMKMLKHLDLTDQQEAQVTAILDQHKEQHQALRDQLKKDRQALHEAVMADTFDEANIRTASKALASDMEEMAVLRGKVASEIRAVLTPEQIAKLKEMRTRHEERMKDRWQWEDME